MTFEEYAKREGKHWTAEEEALVRRGWDAREKAMPPQIYHDSRIDAAIRQRFSEPAKR